MVLSLKRYSRLMEDLQDLAVVAERRDEKQVTADDMKKRLHRRGLLSSELQTVCRKRSPLNCP